MTSPLGSSTTHIFSTPASAAPHESSQPAAANNSIPKKIDESCPLDLTPVGRKHIEKFLMEKRQLTHITWSLNHLLYKLCGYFSRAFSGTKVDLTLGTFYSAGKDFWKMSLEKEFRSEFLEEPEAWGFCDKPPFYFQICFCLPQENISEEEFKRFIDLCIYYVAMENLPELSDIEALREFGLIFHPDLKTVPDAQAERMKKVSENIAFIKNIVGKDLSMFEIPFFDQSRLRVIFSSSDSEKMEPFLLRFTLASEELVPELICETSSREVLTEIAAKKLQVQGKDRTLAYCFNDPSLRSLFGHTMDEKEVQALTPLGLFLYHHTFLPDSNVNEATAVLTLIGLLQLYLVPASDQSPLCKHHGDHLEVSWKTSSSTLFIRVPADQEKSLSLVCEGLKQNRKGCVSSLDQALKIFFSSFTISNRERPPQAVPQAAEIYSALEAEGFSSIVWFLAFRAAGWKNMEAEDLLILPSYLCTITGKDQLRQVSSHLEAVYQASPYRFFFERLKRRLEALDDLNSNTIRLAYLRELITCQESKILSAAWKMWSEYCNTLEPLRSQILMVGICSRMGLDSIPFAVARVCEICHPKKSILEPTYRMQLLVSCLNRLLVLPGNERMVTGYAPPLVQEIEGLLQADPLLDSRIISFNRVQSYLRPPAPAAEPAAVQKEEAPDETWEALLSRQSSSNPRGFAKLVQGFNLALRTKGAQLQSQKGFFQFLKWIVETLIEKKNYKAVLSTLKHVPLKKGDTLYHKWIQTCLEQLMEEETPIEKFIVYAAQFRESGAHPQASQEFLQKLFEYLVRNAHADNKIKEDNIRKEIRFLHDLLKPQGKSVSSFVECLQLYYPTLIEERFAFQFIEDITGHYQLLKNQIETMVSPLFRLLKKSPKDAKLWDKFSKLVEKLKANPEYVLTLYESLTEEGFLARASIMDPPLQMIRKGIAAFEKQLSDPQKVRLAKVLAALLALARQEKKVGELLGGFSSIEAFLGYLQKPETLPSFARLFLDYVLKRKIDHRSYKGYCASMLWIASHALNESKMTEDFRTALLHIPLKDFSTQRADWKRVIAGVISHMSIDPSSMELIRTLIEISDGEEKRFFERCRGRYEAIAYPTLQAWLKDYHATGNIPKVEEVAPLTTVVRPKTVESAQKAAAFSVGAMPKEEAAMPSDPVRPKIVKAVREAKFFAPFPISRPEAPPQAIGVKYGVPIARVLPGIPTDRAPGNAPTLLSPEKTPTEAAPIAPVGRPKTGKAARQAKAAAVNDRNAFIRLLSGAPNEEALGKALMFLSVCTGDEFDLWEKFFSFLTDQSHHLNARAWQIWMLQHPPEKARPEDGKYWQIAICSCLTKQIDVAIFDQFLIHHLAGLIDLFPAENCEPICQICFQIGITSCWKKDPFDYSPKLKALYLLTKRASFSAKTSGLNDLVDLELRVRFYLLMAREKDTNMQEAGFLPFLSMIRSYGMVNNPTFDGNMTLLHNFCSLPHVPEDEKSQKMYFEWIELSWKALKSTLNWAQALSLIEVLCEFNYPNYNVENIFTKWEEIVSDAWEAKPAPTLFERIVSPDYSRCVTVEQLAPPRQISLLVNATGKMMKRLMGKEIEPARKTRFLLAVNPRVKAFRQKYYQKNNNLVSFAPLFLNLAKCSFENISPVAEYPEVMQVALSDILTYFPILAGLWTSDCIESTEAFIGYMPPIMALCTLHPRLMHQALQVIDLYMETAHVRNAPPESLHCWAQLIVSLCSSVSFAPASHRKKIAQAGVKVFARCTNPSLLGQKNTIPTTDHKHLIGISSLIMGLKFLSLTKLECLEPEDWKELFQGLSEHNLGEMLTDLIQDKDKSPGNHISIARIIRYAPALNPEILRPYLTSWPSQLNVLGHDALSLRIRYHYIHACTALLQKKPSPQIDELRNKLITNFIENFFKGVNEANYKKFRTIVGECLQGADLTVVEKMNEAYIFPPNVDTSLCENLLAIKVVDIKNWLEVLRGIPRSRQITEAVLKPSGI